MVVITVSHFLVKFLLIAFEFLCKNDTAMLIKSKLAFSLCLSYYLKQVWHPNILFLAGVTLKILLGV